MKKSYFCSDFHFGIDGQETSKAREVLFLQWLKEFAHDMDALYIVGDLFDFWFEYKNVVPKGGIRILATIAELKESGIPVYLFSGNHDQWMYDYFQQELGISIHHDPIQVMIHGKSVFIGHGDGLGPGDHGYKFIKKIFRHPLSRKLFSLIPPGIGIPLAKYWSGASRSKGIKMHEFLGESQEWLIQYCEHYIKSNHTPIDYFIFGHRHIPIDWTLSQGNRYINLGDWLQYHSFATLSADGLKLSFYKNETQKSYSNFIEKTN